MIPKIVVSPNIKKTSVTIDRNGRIIKKVVSSSSAEYIKKLQEERAKKLGFKK